MGEAGRASGVRWTRQAAVSPFMCDSAHTPPLPISAPQPASMLR